MADTDLPPQSETEPYVPSGTPATGTPPVATDLPNQSETTPYVSAGQPKPDSGAPVTASGVASQFGRGAESAPYHVAGTPVDWGTTVHDVVTNPKFWSFTGPGVQASDLPKRDQPVPGSSDWLMTQGGKLSPQLDPRNYPPQNEAERIARGAGDVAGQAVLGRGAVALVKGVPSAISIGKQLAGAGFGGAGGGAGSVAGRDVTSSTLDLYPNFRKEHPDASSLIEDVGGVVGGGVGGLTASGVANRTGFAAGAPRTTQAPSELRATAGGQYTVAKNIPANYTTSGVSTWANDHLNDLYNKYGSSEIQPVVKQFNKLANPPAGALHVPLNELTSLGDALGKVGKTLPGGVDKLRLAAQDSQNAINSFIRNPPQGSIHSGNPAMAAEYYKIADANWAASLRAQKLVNLQKDAAFAGRPSEQAQVTNLVRPGVIDKQLRGWPEEDKQSLTEFAHGSPVGNWLSDFGATDGHGAGGAFGKFFPVIEGAKWGRELGRATEIPGAGFVGGAIGAAAYPTAKLAARGLASRFQPQLSPIIQQTMARAPGYRPPTPTSPFRTTVPVGLGALSGLSSQ
jgi:hypothetical protein